MIGLDTNVLVRYVTQDDAEQARLAGRLLENTLNPRNPGFVANIVLCELVWVLESGYGYAREPVAQTLQRLFEIDRIRLESPALAWRALDSYRDDGIDFSDALIALLNASLGCDYTISFDKRAARHAQVKLLTRGEAQR